MKLKTCLLCHHTGLQLHSFVCWGLVEGRASSRGVRVWTAHRQLHQGWQNCPCGDHNQLTQEGMPQITGCEQVCLCIASPAQFVRDQQHLSATPSFFFM